MMSAALPLQPSPIPSPTSTARRARPSRGRGWPAWASSITRAARNASRRSRRGNCCRSHRDSSASTPARCCPGSRWPNASTGTSTPLIAGGLRATMNEYAKIPRFGYDRGVWQGQRLISAGLFDAQSTEPYPGLLRDHRDGGDGVAGGHRRDLRSARAGTEAVDPQRAAVEVRHLSRVWGQSPTTGRLPGGNSLRRRFSRRSRSRR